MMATRGNSVVDWEHPSGKKRENGMMAGKMEVAAAAAAAVEAVPAPPPPLFRGLRFYLARTLEPESRRAVKELVLTHGGEIATDSRGAITLVDCDMLDAKKDWVSVNFVKDSMVWGALQDYTQYTGAVFAKRQAEEEARAARRRPRGRQKYTVADDARMLHFAKMETGLNWKSMDQIPLKYWKEAAKRKTTTHSAESMHEHFRKHLRTKTLRQQREIMAEALAIARAQKSSSEDEIEDEAGQTQQGPHASPVPSSVASTVSPHALELAASPKLRVAQAADKRGHGNGGRSENAGDEEIEGRGKRRVKKLTPTRVSSSSSPAARAASTGGTLPKEREAAFSPSSRTPQRSKDGKGGASASSRSSAQGTPAAATPGQEDTVTPKRVPENRSQTSASPPARVATPSWTPPPPPTQCTEAPEATPSTAAGPARPSPPAMSKKQQKQKFKRKKPSHDAVLHEPEGNDGDETSSMGDVHGDHGVFFRSVWDEVLSDPHKRHLLQEPLFSSKRRRSSRRTSEGRTSITSQGTASPEHRRESSSPETAAIRAADVNKAEEDEGEVDNGASQQQVGAEFATESETNAILGQIQLETKQDMLAVVHALYYCSGDAATATTFLKGASPSEMWTAEDDLLLVTLMAEGATRSIVEAAVTRGDFASMQVKRGTDEILARIRFLK